MNPVRVALQARKPSLGAWIQVGHAAVAEIFADAGFDWVAVDCEHTDIGIERFTDVIRGLHGRNSVPLARVRENDCLAIRQVLDMGARGVIVPLVNTAAEAEAAVRAAKYPPRGVRGYAFCRANAHGADFDAYVRAANEDTVVVLMIESRQGVDNIASILAVDGVDGVFLGPYDLSGSYGVPGSIGGPEVREASRRVADACRQAGKAAGIHVVHPTEEAIRRNLDAGFTFIALGMDTVFLNEAARRALSIAKR